MTVDSDIAVIVWELLTWLTLLALVIYIVLYPGMLKKNPSELLEDAKVGNGKPIAPGDRILLVVTILIGIVYLLLRVVEGFGLAT